jgi:hypothetical protein
LYLWCGIIWQFLVKLFLNESEDGSITNTSSPTSSLTATGFTSPHQFQILHPAPQIKPHLLRQTEIDNISHPKNRDGALRDISGYDNFKLHPFRLMQFGCDVFGEGCGVDLYDFILNCCIGGEVSADAVCYLLNLAKTRHEDQDGWFVLLLLMATKDLLDDETHTLMQLFIGTRVLVTEDDGAPFDIVNLLREELIKCI